MKLLSKRPRKIFFFFYWLTRATLVSKYQTKEHILKETQMTVGASIQQVISLHPLGEKKKSAMCQFQCLNNWRSSEFKETPKLQTGKQKHASKQHFLLCRRPKSSSWQQHREVMIPSAATRWQAWNGRNLLREWLRGVYFRGDCHFLSTTLCTACRSIVHGPGYAGIEVNTMPEICKKSLEDIFFSFFK